MSAVPLVPRQVLFGNPERVSPRISPDGKRLAWIAPDDGVLNVWVNHVGADLDAAKAVTEDRDRGIRSFFWAHDNRHLLYIQDVGGDEDWRLFDVDLDTGESWRESAAYAPGERAVVTETPLGPLGLSICYDLRFPALFTALSGAGARCLSIPAAFTVPTGEAHWHVLIRARAIENSCFAIAAAQCGQHEDGRRTYGHSLVVDPWGRVLLDMGSAEREIGFAELDLAQVDEVRARLPVLRHRREFTPPELAS